MGATKAFFEDNAFKAIKWRAGFEIVHGLYDQKLAALAATLMDAEAQYGALEQHLSSARNFLDSTRIPRAEELEERLSILRNEEANLKAQLDSNRRTRKANLGADGVLVE